MSDFTNVRGRREDERADQEDGHHDQHALADAVAVGDATDDVQHDESGQDEQRRHREARAIATLGGMASDSEAKMPGARSAASPEIRTLATTATQSDGRQRERDPGAGDADRDERQQAQPEARVLQHEPRGERDAEDDADDLGGLGDGGDEASLRLGEVEDLLVVEGGERRQADHRRGEERQREPDPPQRADLPEDADRLRPRRRLLVGVDDRLGRAPAARRSKCPRPGSFSRMPRTTNTIDRDDEDEERARASRSASARTPPTSGPMKAPTAFAMRWKPKTSARTSIG